MVVTKDKILAALPHMSQADLLAINSLTAALMQRGIEAVPKSTGDPNTWVFQAVKEVAGSPQTTLPKGFANKANELLSFVEENFPGSLKNRTSGTAVVMMLVHLISDDMRQRGIPRTLGTITLHLSRVQEVFDNAFPGYRQAGLTKLLI